jgi:hypothetical protein
MVPWRQRQHLPRRALHQQPPLHRALLVLPRRLAHQPPRRRVPQARVQAGRAPPGLALPDLAPPDREGLLQAHPDKVRHVPALPQRVVDRALPDRVGLALVQRAPVDLAARADRVKQDQALPQRVEAPALPDRVGLALVQRAPVDLAVRADRVKQDQAPPQRVEAPALRDRVDLAQALPAQALPAQVQRGRVLLAQALRGRAVLVLVRPDRVRQDQALAQPVADRALPDQVDLDQVQPGRAALVVAPAHKAECQVEWAVPAGLAAPARVEVAAAQVTSVRAPLAKCQECRVAVKAAAIRIPMVLKALLKHS